MFIYVYSEYYSIEKNIVFFNIYQDNVYFGELWDLEIVDGFGDDS